MIDWGGTGFLTVNEHGEFPERIVVYGPDGALWYTMD